MIFNKLIFNKLNIFRLNIIYIREGVSVRCFNQMSRYELGLCQKFNEVIHGFNENTSSPEIKDHYICHYTFLFFSDTFTDYIAFAKCYGATIEIVEPIWLYPGGEMVAIYKTFWLRILQRKVRRWLKLKHYIQQNRIYQMLMRREYTSVSIKYE